MTSPKPWVKYEELSETTGKFIVSPLKRGMGTTIGNSLRRVLLSSLPGFAITAIKIEGVEHEYATLPNVVEDVIDIICNLKGVVFKSSKNEPKTVNIKASKIGDVLAKDIICGADVEIINPNHHIAQITAKGNFNVEMIVSYGVGYSPAEANSLENQAINTINVDASFSPIVRVNHEVENIRVGKELDYDNLKLEVVTNGSLKPDIAIKMASNILISHLQLFEFLNQKPLVEENKLLEKELQDQKKESALKLSIDDLELSARSSNCLKRAGIETVEQLMSKGLEELIKIKNFGKKSADEINSKLMQYGLTLRSNEDEAEVEEEDEE